MSFFIKNSNWSFTLCLNFLKIFGFLVPGRYTKVQQVFWRVNYIFWFIYINGIYIIIQAGDLFQIWGDLPLMVSTSFLLFTNLALGTKMVNVMLRADAVQAMIDDCDTEFKNEDRVEGKKIVRSCDRETTQHLYLFTCLSGVAILGWGTSGEKKSLPLRAWYPYDTSKSPAYGITYFHQMSALLLSALLNISLDTLATSLTAACRCRLRLVHLSLRSLCAGIVERENNELHTHHQENIVLSRLKATVRRHQAALQTADEIQRCFSEPILAQFSVSVVIICVTAYQMAVELQGTSKNVPHIVAMTAYLLVMILQVFLYCYQGNQLTIESSEISSAAYECPWYSCSLRSRRALLNVMIRSQRDTKLTACGFTTLSLACFTAIVKASYTFFTVLQRVEDRQK